MALEVEIPFFSHVMDGVVSAFVLLAFTQSMSDMGAI